MTLRRHAQDWETVAHLDPYWAILSDPRKRLGKWDRDEFFATDLAMFLDDQFDMVYCRHVLSRIPSRSAVESYIAEFVRVLRPEGLLVFHLTTHITPRHRFQMRRHLYSLLRSVGIEARFLFTQLGLNPIQMHALPEERVRRTLAANGAIVHQARHEYIDGYTESGYYVTKASGAGAVSPPRAGEREG